MKKQEKKFVLAGLALLAITGLLALAGCKNDTVPEPTRYTVKFDKNAEDASGEMQSQIFTEGVEQELSVNQFKRATYTFSGWSEDNDATAPTYKDKAKFKATKDTTLYAVWTDNGTVAPVNFSLPDGTKFYFGESIEVSLETTTDGATIHYAVNGGEEKTGDSPVTVSVTGDTTITTITARATKDGLKPSDETTATYTVRKLEGITPPARTVYSVGEKVASEIEVTATYDDEEERTVTGTITTDTNTLTKSAGVQTVTVRYSEGGIEVSGQFEIRVLPKKLTDYKNPNNTDGSWTYMEFGEWPQTIKDDDVFVDESKSKEMGMFTYYLGSDENYYVKHSDKYYKVEPIVWRVLNKDYASTGKALLLAESILTGGIPYYHFDREEGGLGGVEWSGPRIIGGKTIHPNNYEHSQIRAWLNGLSYQSKESEGATQSSKDEYKNAGFLQTAFTESARKLIADTSVDNSAASTIPSGIPDEDLESYWENGENPYACDNTTDKIFLLSEQEATNREYGFGAYDDLDIARIRVTTDYAKATGANQDSTPGYGGWWWLRSPFYNLESYARDIRYDGSADECNVVYSNVVSSAYGDGGVVPALSISLQ